MVAIVVTSFGGEKPIVQPRMLSDSESVIAQNVRLISGRLEPLKATTSLTPSSTIQPSAKTLYRYGSSSDKTKYWLSWVDEVSVIPSPIANDQYDRLYWTSPTTAPQYAPNDKILSTTKYPGASYLLGIPKPSTSPTASGTAVTEYTSVTRNYILTLSGAGSLISLPSKTYTVTAVDGKDVIFTGLTTDNLGDTRVTDKKLWRKVGSTYRLVATIPLATDTYTDNATDAALGSATALPTAIASAITAPTAAPRATASSTATSPGAKTRRYRLSMVSVQWTNAGTTLTFSESLPSDITTVSGVYDKQPVSLVIAPPNSTTVPGVTFATYSLFREIDGQTGYKVVVQGVASGSTTIVDNIPEGSEGLATYNPDPSIGPSSLLKPTITSGTKDASFVAPTTESRVYVVTYVNGATPAVESPPSPVSAAVSVNDGMTVTISHADAYPTGVVKKRIYRKLDSDAVTAYRRVDEINVSQTSYTDTKLTATIASNASIPTDFQTVLPTPETSPTIEAKIPAKVIPETRIYAYTYLSTFGEEGPLSEASAPITIDPSKSVSISGIAGSPSGSYSIAKTYLYRSSTVGTSAQFQFVAELPIGTSSYTDSKDQASLGEVCPSITWEPPPAKLAGLKLTASGMAVGYVSDVTYDTNNQQTKNDSRTVRMSELNLPHAWPAEYSFITDHSIIGLGVFRQSVAVLTTSFPYVISGVDPSSATMTRLELRQGCTSSRCIIETGDGVIYASPDGLISISDNGINNVTSNVFSREQWQELNPSTMQGYYHDGRLHILYTNTSSVRGMLILDFSGQGALVSRSDLNKTTAITTGYQDASTDKLYWAQGNDTTNANDPTKSYGLIRVHNDDETSNLTYTWRSKVFRTPYPLNFMCAQVLAETYPADGASVPLKLSIYADGTKITFNDPAGATDYKLIKNSKIFTLPSGFRAFDWQFELEGNVKVFSVVIAQSPEEIKAV